MEQALYQATILTFEELGFMFPAPDTDPWELDPASSAATSVSFQGEFDGRLVLQVESSMLPTIAENMLGEEIPLEEEMQHDVLCEITNVICGNVLPMIAGKQAVFRLNAPQFMHEIESHEEPSAVARLNLEEGRAEVLLFVTEKP